MTDAAQLMVDERIGALPVVDGGQLVGIVTEGDLIMQDVKLEFPTYIHLLDGFIMYPPSQTQVRERAQEGGRGDGGRRHDARPDHRAGRALRSRTWRR